MARRLIEASPQAVTSPAVRIRGLRRTFGSNVVLDDLDLDIAPGEFVALLGRSGSGKSTLLRILAGLDLPQAGSTEVVGAASVAFQEPRLLPWRRVADNVGLGLRRRSRADRRARAAEVLGEVGLTDKTDAWPVTLSGGQAQRASLARALVNDPELLLLDEPFSALDALTRIEMHALVLKVWNEHRPSVLLVTHDVDEALRLADRVIVLSAGRIVHESRVTNPRPRALHDEAIAHRRIELLGHLGVAEPESSHPAQKESA
jgi:sulfonate transport system ATP-binding protein